MGHGIALTFARAGHDVAIYDPAEDMLDSAKGRVSDSLRLLGDDGSDIAAILERLELCESIRSAVERADFVFEAAPEKLELKQAAFKEIEAHAPSEAVLASNTSAIRISKIMAGLRSRHRALGTHWWNPPHMIPLVEVV